MTNLQLERELKDTKAEKCKLEQLVLDLQEKVAELEQELGERAQQATASSLVQIASFRKDLDEHLDTTNRYLAQLKEDMQERMKQSSVKYTRQHSV